MWTVKVKPEYANKNPHIDRGEKNTLWTDD